MSNLDAFLAKEQLHELEGELTRKRWALEDWERRLSLRASRLAVREQKLAEREKASPFAQLSLFGEA